MIRPEKKWPFAARLFALAFALVALCGCYSTRWTGVYRDIPLLEGDEDPFLEESETSQEKIEHDHQRLEELANEEEPVYRMNAGDVIAIRVYGHEDLDMVTKLGPDGRIGFAFMGQVKLSNMTLAEASDAIRDGLAPYVKNPVVSITLKEVASETATIAGACARPGVYPISNTTRLADLYAKAGSSAERLFNGVDIDVADLGHSIIMRDGEILPVDFLKAINQGDRLHNIRIKTGDYVFIAQRMESSVTICGDVKHPHKRLFENGMGLIETLTSAGWMAETHWSHVIIIRDGLVNPRLYKVDVDGILAGRCRNVVLKANDIIYVPKDSMAEYNVFVKKLMPTAQLVNLVTGGISDRVIFSSEE